MYTVNYVSKQSRAVHRWHINEFKKDAAKNRSASFG